MKLIATAIISFSLIFSNAMAGSGYEKAMGENIAQIFTAESAEQLDGVTNKFVRIAEAEKDKWLPYYYGSLASIFKSFRMTEAADKDAALDKAQTLLNKAAELEENNSELPALQGFLYMISLSVDPGSRGQTMSGKAFAEFEKALAIKVDNPRALLFKGEMMYGTAQFFGTGTEQACEMVSKSIELFEKNQSNKGIMPSWGLHSALKYQEQCNASDSDSSTPSEN